MAAWGDRAWKLSIMQTHGMGRLSRRLESRVMALPVDSGVDVRDAKAGASMRRVTWVRWASRYVRRVCRKETRRLWNLTSGGRGVLVVMSRWEQEKARQGRECFWRTE